MMHDRDKARLRHAINMGLFGFFLSIIISFIFDTIEALILLEGFTFKINIANALLWGVIYGMIQYLKDDYYG